MDQQFIKGIPFSTLEYAKAISLLKGWIHEQQEKPRFVVTANPEIVMSAKENTEKYKAFHIRQEALGKYGKIKGV